MASRHNQPKAITYQGDQWMRLDVFLTDYFAPRYSRSYWSNMIEHDYVTVDSSSIKTGFKLQAGKTIMIDWPAVTDEFSELITLVYEDDSVIVINKPAGLLSHSKGDFNPEYTAADFFAGRCKSPIKDARGNIVHRLDRQTSGAMIGAKTLDAREFLSKQFADRQVQKHYVAVVEGVITDAGIDVDVPLARSPKRPKTFKPDSAGKSAQTHIQVLSLTDNTSTVLLQPHTGRTHQLRVHLKHIGHPIIGDTEYGAKTERADKRFLLHAYSLRLTLPDQTAPQTFIAPIPADMSSYVHESDLKSYTKSAN